jgi:hypothetical protein
VDLPKDAEIACFAAGLYYSCLAIPFDLIDFIILPEKRNCKKMHRQTEYFHKEKAPYREGQSARTARTKAYLLS